MSLILSANADFLFYISVTDLISVILEREEDDRSYRHAISNGDMCKGLVRISCVGLCALFNSEWNFFSRGLWQTMMSRTAQKD